MAWQNRVMSIPLPGQPAPAPGAGDGSGETAWAARADSDFVTVARPVRRPASAPSSAATATATAALVAVALGLFFIVMLLSYELNMNIPVDEYSIDLPWTVVTPGLLTAWLAGTLTGAGVVAVSRYLAGADRYRCDGDRLSGDVWPGPARARDGALTEPDTLDGGWAGTTSAMSPCRPTAGSPPRQPVIRHGPRFGSGPPSPSWLLDCRRVPPTARLRVSLVWIRDHCVRVGDRRRR